MGNTVIIYVLGTLLLFLIVTLNINRGLSGQSESSYNYYGEIQTRNIGNSMVAMLISQVADDAKYRVINTQNKTLLFGQADYSVRDTFVSPDSLIKISVTASYMNQTKNIIALLDKSKNQIPGAFKFSLISGGNMSLSGGTNFSPSDPTKNANLKTNSAFSIGNNNMVRGFVGYGTNFSGNENKIQPNDNPENLPVRAISQDVKIPTFNPADFKSAATQVYNGDYNLGSSINIGTKSNPSIIYVGGNLSISSGAQLRGFIIFVVAGTIVINGGTEFINTDPLVSNFAFYSLGNISVSGNATVYGQMLSRGNISFSGNSDLYGTAAAAGTMSFTGGASVEVAAAQELTDPLWGAKEFSRPFVPRHYYE